MGKKIKFPLEMAGGKKVKELEELREYFDLEKAIEYFGNGKLQNWLDVNYCDDILKRIEQLSGKEENFIEQFLNILGVDSRRTVNSEKVIQEARIKEKLKQYIPEEKVRRMIHDTADNQELMEMLCKQGNQKIYLLDGVYSIPTTISNIRFEGIGSVFIKLETQEKAIFLEQNLSFENIMPIDEEAKEMIGCDEDKITMKELKEIDSDMIEWYEILDNQIKGKYF